MLPSFVEEEKKLDAEIKEAQEYIDVCESDKIREAEDKLDTLLMQKKQLDNYDGKWIVHPSAIEQYKLLYAPYINLQINPLLESSDHSHIDIWPRLSECLKMWLDEQLSLEQCLSKMDSIYRKYSME